MDDLIKRIAERGWVIGPRYIGGGGWYISEDWQASADALWDDPEATALGVGVTLAEAVTNALASAGASRAGEDHE